jgi:hypothetical protein
MGKPFLEKLRFIGTFRLTSVGVAAPADENAGEVIQVLPVFRLQESGFLPMLKLIKL